jgi:hypothetical protein
MRKNEKWEMGLVCMQGLIKPWVESWLMKREWGGGLRLKQGVSHMREDLNFLAPIDSLKRLKS